MIESSLIRVAVGVVCRGERVLIAKRLDHQLHGGLWEFPGGKVHANESIYQALQRELNEEVGIMIRQAMPFMQVQHCYQPDRIVDLHVWTITEFSGIAHGREGQTVCWVVLDALNQYSFPEANRAIIRALVVSNESLITG